MGGGTCCIFIGGKMSADYRMLHFLFFLRGISAILFVSGWWRDGSGMHESCSGVSDEGA